MTPITCEMLPALVEQALDDYRNELPLGFLKRVEGMITEAKAVPSGPNFKRKFECLVEHAKRQDQELERLRYDENVRRFYDEGAVWFWAGDETDNLETLACPVVINAGDLRALLGSGACRIIGKPPALVTAASSPELKALDKQCRDDVARALGLAVTDDNDYSWSFMLARINAEIDGLRAGE